MNQENGGKNAYKGDNFRSSLKHTISYTRDSVGHHGLQGELIKDYSEVAKLGIL